METTRSSIGTVKAPAHWYAGDAYADAVAAPAGTSTSPPPSFISPRGARRVRASTDRRIDEQLGR
jgi:hypothetical protein